MEYIYSVLLLKNAGKEINEGNIKRVLEAAGIKIDEAKIRALVASLSEINIDEVIKESVAPVAIERKEVREEKREEKKEEKKPEEAAAGLGSLFG